MSNDRQTDSLLNPLTDTAVLEARQIGRRHESGWLLRDIHFAVRAGQRIALIGRSGSGKTLLLRALSMLDPIDAGELRWHGETISGNQVPPFRQQVMYLQQRTSATDGTVEQWLRQPFDLQAHRERTFDRSAIVAHLKSIGRDERLLARQHRDLSGGELQLMAVLRSLQLNPQILLLDEPTSALDDQTTSEVEMLIQNWFESGDGQRSFVWVTHNQQQVHRVADQIVRMDGGQIQAVSA